MATDTKLDSLVINYLTQAQYDNAKSEGTLNSNQIKTAVAKQNKPHLVVSLQHYTSGDHARPFEGAIQTIDDGQKTVQPAPNSSSSILLSLFR